MSRLMHAIPTALFLFSFSLQPAAASEAVSSSSAVSSAGSSADGDSRPFALYGSVGSGYGLVWGSDYGQSPSGAHVLLGVLGAARLASWEIDGGLSWLYSDINGQTSGGLPVNVRMRAGTVDLGARYRLGSQWQVGPALDLLFGTDTSFGPSIGSAQADLLVGAKALYELPKLPLPVRLWAQVSTDTSFAQHLFVALAGVQMGIPVRLGRSPSAAVKVSVREVALHSSYAAPELKGREVKVVLDSQRIFFGTMSSEVRPELFSALKDVGKYLVSGPVRLSKILVAGHADQRGRFEYNLKLSRKRALAVSDALVSGGVDPKGLEIEAFSYLAPLDAANNRVAWAKNRRVEITFENVQDPEGLRRQLAPLATESPREIKQ